MPRKGQRTCIAICQHLQMPGSDGICVSDNDTQPMTERNQQHEIPSGMCNCGNNSTYTAAALRGCNQTAPH